MNNNSNIIEKLFITLGCVFIILGLTANEFFLVRLFSPDGAVSAFLRLLVWFFDIFFIVWGVITIKYWRKEIVSGFNLVLFSIFFVLLFMESYLRIYGWWLDRELRVVRRSDEYLHHTLRENAFSKVGGLEARVRFYTNSLAYRDATIREVAHENTSARRILFLGDSFTEGFGVDYEKSAVGFLGAIFDEKGEKVEILNAGVNSYAPSLHYKKLKQFFDNGYETDEVVLMLDISDIADDGVVYFDARGEFAQFDEDGGITYDKDLGSQPLYRTTYKADFYPKVLSWMDMVVRTLSRERGEDPWPDQKESSKGKWTEGDRSSHEWVLRGIRITEDSILKIKDLAERNSAEFSFVIYPWPTQLKSSQRPSKAEIIFGDFAREHGIGFLNLYPFFFSLGEGWREYYFPGDKHWNEKGNAFTAQLLYNYLGKK